MAHFLNLQIVPFSKLVRPLTDSQINLYLSLTLFENPCRFLSVDPLVGNPLSAQDYNGYSYCANNPLAFTDPSGYSNESLFSFIDRALNSDFGGHWSEGGGGTLFTSDADALQGGVDYNNANNSWANTRYPGGASVVSSSSTKISVSFNFSRFGITKGSWLSLWGRLKDAFFFDSKTTGTSWLEANSSVDLVNQNQTNTDMLPDWTKLSTTERVRYLLEAGAASDTKLVNIHNVFKNFNPQSGDLQYGIMVSKPVVVNLGGTNYRIGMQLYVNPRTSDNYYNPVFDIHINNPNRITTGYGECTIYNIGSRTQMYLLIYGDESQSDIFEKWYPIG